MLHVQIVERIAQSVNDRKVRAPRTAVSGVSALHVRCFRRHGQDEAGTVAVRDLPHGGNQVDDFRRRRVAKIRVARIQGQRASFQIDIQAVKAVRIDNAFHGADKFLFGLVGGQFHGSVGSSDGDQHLLPWLCSSRTSAWNSSIEAL